MKFLATAVVGVVLATSGAHAAEINFETFSAGDVLTGLTDLEVDGVGYDITVASNGMFDVAMIFDTDNFSGDDGDLAATFTDGMGGTSNPGNVLIISEDGDSSDPDDEQTGGTITFAFDSAVNLLGFDAFDDVTLTVSTDQGDSIMVNVANDNEFASVTTNFFNVTEVIFDFGDQSGAIDNLQVSAVPLPAPLLLLMAGLGGLGAAARRRKAA